MNCLWLIYKQIENTMYNIQSSLLLALFDGLIVVETLEASVIVNTDKVELLYPEIF